MSRPLRTALLCAGLLALSACQPKSVEAPAAASSPSANAAQLAQLQLGVDQLLARYRQMIVLMDDEVQLKPAERRAVAAVGQLIFHEMREGTESLWKLSAAHQDPALVAALAQVLDRIESEPTWFDADRLAFKDYLGRIAEHYAGAQSLAALKLAKRASEDLAVLAEVEQAYERELKDAFGRFGNKRGIELKREKWSDYVAKLRGLYSREQILRDYATIVPYASAAPATAASAAAPRELFGEDLPPKTVLLTFDDGPHGRYTDEILEILKRYQAPAVFFSAGPEPRQA